MSIFRIEKRFVIKLQTAELLKCQFFGRKKQFVAELSALQLLECQVFNQKN